MTETTNLGLQKPDYTDGADIAVVNGNMDTIDAAFSGIQAGKAGNTILGSGSIPVSAWTGSGPYTAVVTPESKDRANCRIAVDFASLTDAQAEEILGCGICEASHTDTSVTLRALSDKPSFAVPLAFTWYD